MSRDDDVLERATRALRATPPPNDGELALARQRMLAAHNAATKGGPRGRTLRWVLPLAAVLAAGTALAAVPHAYERLASAVNRVVGFEVFAFEVKPPAPAKSKSTQVASAPKLAPVSEPQANEPPMAEPEGSPEPAVVSEPAPQPVASAARPPVHKPQKREVAPAIHPPQPAVEPAPEPAPEAPAPIASADLAKYRSAHQAHFQQRDFALALRNWEAYLRQFPNGTFAIEARYNRAICLLHLGRNDEARRALTPFARGEIGRGYRQAEATKLLEALE
ncbi:MAG TPA: tetratricopeptide repeat protein [Polyangiales bacterium]